MMLGDLLEVSWEVLGSGGEREIARVEWSLESTLDIFDNGVFLR
jgi:hypothetical protein